MNPSQLAAWMNFYKQQGLGDHMANARDTSGASPFNMNMMAANWAARMAQPDVGGGAGPDFFGGESTPRYSPNYVSPEQIPDDRYVVRARGGGRMPMMTGMGGGGERGNSDLRPQINNLGAALLRRGSARYG